jgi:hypothetical protein
MEQVAKMASIAYAVNPNLTMNPLLVEKHFRLHFLRKRVQRLILNEFMPICLL